MFGTEPCPKCSFPMSKDEKVCAHCGYELANSTDDSQQGPSYLVSGSGTSAPNLEKRIYSFFDGTLGELIGLNLICFFVTLFTLGICTPWAFCRYYRWEAEHTVIDGKRLLFYGKGLDLFGEWIKWLLLTIITLGIYGLWVGIKLRQWKAEHTHS